MSKATNLEGLVRPTPSVDPNSHMQSIAGTRKNSLYLALLLLHERTPRTLTGWVAGFRTMKRQKLITEHRYLRVLAQAILLILSLYFSFRLCGLVQNDLEWRAASYGIRESQLSLFSSLTTCLTTEIVQEAAQCRAEYEDNACLTLVIPALIERCHTWKRCMERDLASVSRLNLLAELAAEVSNVFVDCLTWKSSVRSFSFEASIKY